MKSLKNRVGLSLIETTFSTLLVSILMVASLSTIAQVSGVASHENLRLKAAELGNLYLEEICSKPFVCPDCGSTAIGRGSNEGSIRASWNDCDDYSGLYLTTLTDENGNAIPDTTGWKIYVVVQFVLPDDPNSGVHYATDLKRVSIWLQDPTREYHNFRALRSMYGTMQSGQENDLLSGIEIRLQTDSKEQVLRSRPLNQLEVP